MDASLFSFCRELAKNFLFVQGPGGNISLKSGDKMWIKASGTWLARADESTFVQIDLHAVKNHIQNKHFKFELQAEAGLPEKPSIETLMHAVLPHRYVLHLHAVASLAHLVRSDFASCVETLTKGDFQYAIIDYAKPGPELAEQVFERHLESPDVNIFFLKNHGLVIGGESLEYLLGMLNGVENFFDSVFIKQTAQFSNVTGAPQKLLGQYTRLRDSAIQQLALDPSFFEQLRKSWALYPDHVVFLGPSAFIYLSCEQFCDEVKKNGIFPDLVFIKDTGVYSTNKFSETQLLQLKCYSEVIRRQNDFSKVVSLSQCQASELLNWDAEKHRKLKN